MDYPLKLGETKSMVRKVSTRESGQENVEQVEESCIEKGEWKESKKLNAKVPTITEKTKEVKPDVVYGVAIAIWLLSIWHPYWALLVAVTIAIAKYSEDWESEVDDESPIDIASLLENRKKIEKPHSEDDPDYLKGVYIARRNKKKIAKAITDGDSSYIVYVGWQEHLRDVKRGLSSELGLRVIDSYPFFVEVLF